MKCFPKLNQTHVRIEIAGGESIAVPMLPVRCLDDIRQIKADMKTVKDEAGMLDVKSRLVELVKTVLPQEYHENLARMDIRTLVELAAYLMFGDDDDQPKEKSVPVAEVKKGKQGGAEAEKKSV